MVPEYRKKSEKPLFFSSEHFLIKIIVRRNARV